MSTDSADDERIRWSPWAIAAAILLLLIFGVIAFGTVRGCFFSDPEEAAKTEDEKQKKKKDEEEKRELQISPPIVMPAEPKTPLPLVKPGHWETISQEMRMNFRDFVGDSRASIVDAQNRPYAVAKTPYNVRASRPVLLSKARWKSTETTLFLPDAEKSVFLSTELEERGIGFGLTPMRTPLTPMPSYQYHFVVLAKDPSRYAYLKMIDSVKAPYGGMSADDEQQEALLYSVSLLQAGQSVALPDNPLTWTSTAYMLWDEVDPGDPITPDQKEAIVDWIHWGGQLIINGPDSLDKLKGSFLEPYLPATSGGPVKIAADDPAIAELNKNWMISTEKVPGEPLKPNVPWSGVKLIPAKVDGKPLPGTGGLFVERQVGRGRIVVSAMQLNERDLINWRSGFESFFNACLMRRPARKYLPGYYGPYTITWDAENLRSRRLDAALNTNLRFFARDAGLDTAYRWENVQNDAAYPQYGQSGQPATFREYKPNPTNPGGMGAWSDFNATSNAARAALREAAGVEVPGSDFVVLCLAAYLVALVPINWVIFRTIGRIEWAWIAAPIIALVGTWIIVQRAQLDIGFVRAQTEIAILEQQPNHARAHLSRYTALYTSLSTTYDFQSENRTTLAAPFPSVARAEDFQMLIGQGLTPVNFQRYEDVRLVGLPISSNSTGMVHSEQMHKLEGAIREGISTALGTPQIENHSKLELHSVCIVSKTGIADTSESETSKRYKFEGRWIGDLLPGQSAPSAMATISDKKPFYAEERTKEAGQIRTPRLNLEPLFQQALDPKFMEDGETRLVARVDEVLPGEIITPEASQVRGATLVVVHLKYALPPRPEKDSNTRRDIKATDDLPGTEPVEL